MFLFWLNLYIAFFRGEWYAFTYAEIGSVLQTGLNAIGQFATSIFGDGNMTDLGDLLITPVASIRPFMAITAFVLALITSIGIVAMAVKGVKKAFGIFFMGLR